MDPSAAAPNGSPGSGPSVIHDNPTPFRLLELPNEVLLRILEYLLPYTDRKLNCRPLRDEPTCQDFVPWVVPETSDDGTPPHIPQVPPREPYRTGILRANRRLHQLGSRVLYRTNVFSILVQSKYNAFVCPVPTNSFGRIISQIPGEPYSVRTLKLELKNHHPLENYLAASMLRQVDIEVWARRSAKKDFCMGWRLGWKGPIDRRIFTRVNELCRFLEQAKELQILNVFVRFDMKMETAEHMDEVKRGFSAYLAEKLEALKLDKVCFHGEYLEGGVKFGAE